MTIWVLAGDVDGMERAVLVDSVTERPFNLPAFESSEAAECFLDFVATRVADVLRVNSAVLDALHTAWLELPECVQCGERVVHPGERPDECEKCRPTCDWTAAGGDWCDARGTEQILTSDPGHLSLDRYCAIHATQVRRQKAKNASKENHSATATPDAQKGVAAAVSGPGEDGQLLSLMQIEPKVDRD